MNSTPSRDYRTVPLPGALVVAFYDTGAPVARGLGFPPSLTAIFLAILFVLILFDLGYLLYWSRKSGSSLGRLR